MLFLDGSRENQSKTMNYNYVLNVRPIQMETMEGSRENF
jgi:hypothetical protein